MSGEWIGELLGGAPPAEGETVERSGRRLIREGAVVRDVAVVDTDQAQTRDIFAFKWGKRETYASDQVRAATKGWLKERYGDLAALVTQGDRPLTVLDAGCGSGFSGSLAFEEALGDIRYVGADISAAVDLAAADVAPRAGDSFFVQGDVTALPFAPKTFDIVFSEGVMHHTPSTRTALLSLARLVRPGGVFAFYVYAKKAPIREFTDDLIRQRIADMDPQAAWDALMPLTRLGKALGDLDIELEVPEAVDLLGIPAGKHNLQRLFYWYVCKAYYRPEYVLDEMNHINFDWFMPKYCHRQTPAEVEAWCNEAGLKVERLWAEDAGITVIARA